MNAEDSGLPYSLTSPSLSFYTVRFEDRTSDYDYADIQCFRAREQDGQFEMLVPVDAAHFNMNLNVNLKIDIDLPNFTTTFMEGIQTR